MDIRNYDAINQEEKGLPFVYTIDKFIAKGEEGALKTPMWHEQLEIKLILFGSAEITCDAKNYILNKGDIFVVNACQMHNTKVVSDEGVGYHMLVISPENLFSDRLGQFIHPVFSGKLCFKNHIHNDEKCQNLLTSFFKELSEQKDGYELASVGLLSLFFSHLMRTYALKEALDIRYKDIQRHAYKITPAFEMIDRLYASVITVEMLAEACNISKFHFCRLFKLVTGQTAINYINEFRINKAEFLLISTDMKINEIAQMVGFLDNNYFARMYKKLKGITPSETRSKNVL